MWLGLGTLLGIAATATVLLWESPDAQPDSVNRDEAQALVTAYCKYKAGMCALLAVDIDQAQLDVMQWTREHYGESVHGYRLFMCKNAEGQTMAIIRPLGTDGMEFGETYYLAPGPLFSGCPVVCDRMQPSLELCLE